MTIEEMTAGVSDYMGRPYGDVPQVLGPEEYNAAFGNPFGDYPRSVIGAMYDEEEHILVVDSETPKQIVFHELTHAYMRNHWPGFYKMIRSTKNQAGWQPVYKFFVQNALDEGLAETVAFSLCDWPEQRMALCEPEVWSLDYSTRILDKVFDDSIPKDVRIAYFEIGSRSIGYNVVKRTLERADDKHEAFKGLLMARLTPKQLHARLFC